MFVKLHAEGALLAVNTDKIAAIQPINFGTCVKTQVNFGDDFVNVDESLEEVIELVTSNRKTKKEV